VLDRPALVWTAPAGDFHHGLPAGTRVGAYRIVGLIGRGGMGEVYRANAPTAVRAAVALKLIRREAAEHVERFQLERQTLARLDHRASRG